MKFSPRFAFFLSVIPAADIDLIGKQADIAYHKKMAKYDEGFKFFFTEIDCDEYSLQIVPTLYIQFCF